MENVTPASESPPTDGRSQKPFAIVISQTESILKAVSLIGIILYSFGLLVTKRKAFQEDSCGQIESNATAALAE